MSDFKEKYLHLVEEWKEEYKRHNSDPLTTEAFAEILKVDASHFRRMVSKPYKINEKMYEDLLMRFLVWQIAAVKRFISTRQLNLLPAEDVLRRAVFDIRVDQVKLDALKQKKSDSIEPDYLLTLRKQISSALVNLQEAMQTLPEPIGPEIGAVGDPAFRKAGKTKRTERQ